MAEPSCCAGPLEITTQILLEFLGLATNPPESLFPIPSDSQTDLYRKILLTLPYI